MCNVELRGINLWYYKIHNNLLTYRWKPLIIAVITPVRSTVAFQLALKEFPVVFWFDTSTFVHANMTWEGFMSKIDLTQEPQAYLVSLTSHSTYSATSEGNSCFKIFKSLSVIIRVAKDFVTLNEKKSNFYAHFGFS